jgi:sugar lactone lactonase YvrE
MTRWRILLTFGLSLFLCLSLVLVACGDNTPTTAPTSTTTASTTAAATTVASTTAVPTTIPPTRLIATTAATNNSPVELVRKIDTSASVKIPRGMAVDKQGDLYVVDAQENTINKFDATGKFVSRWGQKGSGDGEFNFSRDQQPFKYAGFLAIDTAGNVYVSDTYNHRVQKFDADGKFLTKWGSQGTADGKFNAPVSIVLDSQNNLYVSDSETRIQKFDTNGKFLSSYKNPGDGDGQFIVGLLTAVDKQGNLYVADPATHRVLIFDSNWNYLRKLATQGKGEGQFINPSDVALDSKGNLYISDVSSPTGGGRIQIFNPAGKFVGQWDSPGNGEAAFGAYEGPMIDRNDNIYFSRYFDASVIYVFHLKP